MLATPVLEVAEPPGPTVLPITVAPAGCLARPLG